MRQQRSDVMRALPSLLLTTVFACSAPRSVLNRSAPPNQPADLHAALFPAPTTPLLAIPEHATADLVAVRAPGADACDVWRRDGRYVGRITLAACTRWPSMNAAGSPRSPDGSFSFERGDGAWRLWTRDHTAPVAQVPQECDPERAAWAPSTSSVVLPCEGALRVIDTRTGRAAFELPLGGARLVAGPVWTDRVRVILEQDQGERSLSSWVPGSPPTRSDERSSESVEYAFDPVTHETWRHVHGGTATGSRSLVEATAPRPGATATALRSEVYEAPDERPEIAWNLSGTAFVRVDSRAHDIAVHFVSLGPPVRRAQEIAVDAPGDGRGWVVVAARPTPRGDRAVIVSAQAGSDNVAPPEVRILSLDGGIKSIGAPQLTSAGGARKLELVVQESEAILKADGRLYVQSLEPPFAGRWMSDGERAGWREPVATARFETRDGVVLRRRTDEVDLNVDAPCWFPLGWPVTAAPMDVRVGDVHAGTLMGVGAVRRVFCADPTIVQRFLRGEPMPPRPAAFLGNEPR
jgi:hypothetical protein